MPYAVYSKRTGIISRIVHDLASLQPSENMIEVDDEVSFMRESTCTIEGQKVNTFGVKMFDLGGVPTIKPFDFDLGEVRPAIQKYPPIYESYTAVGRMDLPIYANPFLWTAEELIQVKYDSVLAKNYPYQVIIGEEFINTDHINVGSSSNFILSEGKCILNPGGVLMSDWFYTRVEKRIQEVVAAQEANYFSQFTFDTAYFSSVPELPGGVYLYHDVTAWNPMGVPTSWAPMTADDEVDIAGTINPIGLAKGIRIKIVNATTEPFIIESYMLMLRMKRYRDHLLGP